MLTRSRPTPMKGSAAILDKATLYTATRESKEPLPAVAVAAVDGVVTLVIRSRGVGAPRRPCTVTTTTAMAMIPPKTNHEWSDMRWIATQTKIAALAASSAPTDPQE